MNMLSRYLQVVILISMAALWYLEPLSAGQERARATDCFPFESLPGLLRERAEQLLLNALDSEALYTIAADIKPMSSGIGPINAPPPYKDPIICLLGMLIFGAGLAIVRWHKVRRSNWTVLIAMSCFFLLFIGWLRISTLARRNVDELDEIMRTWRCGGEVSGGLFRYKAVYKGKHPMEVMVFNHPLLTNVLTARADVFATLGLSSSSSPPAILHAVDSADQSIRFRGFGLLFGYPSEAVEFFVAADVQQRTTGKFIERDRVSLPTFHMFLGEGRFIYVVPKGQSRTDVDRALAARVQPVFDEYLKRRVRYIHGSSGTGVLSLVREWFDDGNGDVRPSHAWRRAYASNQGLPSLPQ
jgi:hypothetical protein